MAALLTANSADNDSKALSGIFFQLGEEFAVYADVDCALDLTPLEFHNGALVQVRAGQRGDWRLLGWFNIPPFEHRQKEQPQFIRRALRLPSGFWRIHLLVNERVVAMRDVQSRGEKP